MKTILIAICLLSAHFAFAQQADTVIHINKLTGHSYYLEQGWKFYIGDNPAFADSAYNDNDWKSVDLWRPIPDLPTLLQSGTGWLRLHIKVADSLKARATLIVYNATPIQVYLNGRLIAKSDKYINHPILLKLSGKSTDVLAFRYAHLPQLKYISKGSTNSPLLVAVFTNSGSFFSGSDGLDSNFVKCITVAGIFILLGILHVAFLIFNPAQKANLYFSLYAFFLAFFYILASLGIISGSIQGFYAYLFPANLFLYAGSLLGIKALYTLFDFNTGWYFKALVVFSIIVFPFYVFGNFMGGNADALILWAVFITGVFLCVKAARVKKRGSLILAAGFFTAIISSIIFYAVALFFRALYLPWVNNLVEAGMYLCPPFAISIYLAREFSLDSKLLQTKLIEVEALSAQTIIQEREKQQILTAQNDLLEQKVASRTEQLNKSLNDLKTTQTQLIQTEKMASLGELTAGIAHEIQNPLNFVNNFSEVSQELMEELKEELDKGDTEEAKLIATDVIDNLAKIHHHGKRADGIVKGMLEHSRASTGQKEPTDLNKLADEYLRLSYHGLRAKDKSFNAEMLTHFDEHLPLVNILPQEVGRVLLNLFNNAFYAVSQKKKTASPDYKPTVEVSTSLDGDNVMITVKDNGMGIPEAIKDKIMQPFFTTKPTGEGTGLGLSLSYDIVVKGHGGAIQINSAEGEGSEFTIQLPIS